jgi:hypothetical protein
MKQENITALLNRYNAGDASEEDLLLMENLLEKGIVKLEDLHDINVLGQKVDKLETPAPTLSLDDKFYQLLAAEKRSQRGFNFLEWISANTFFTQLAYASVIFIVGLGIGYLAFHNESKSTTEMVALSNEVKNLKEMMMLSLLEQESATDRLKAVSLSQELEESSNAVTQALIKTLNKDENVNVRLAALEALKPYVHNSEVRQELIRSISKQDSPLVQIALAELMASLQEKSSVKEFDKLLQDRKTPGEVKNRIRKSIEVLI